MKSKRASGLQIAFFTFAVVLLVVPLTQRVASLVHLPGEAVALLNQSAPFLIAAALVLLIPPLRRACNELLQAPVPRSARTEVALVTAAKVLLPFALLGGLALWHWFRGGEPALTRFHGQWRTPEAVFHPASIVGSLVVAGVLAPLLEELVFRGMLYRAWERELGWIPSMLLTSLLFALYHPVFLSAFLASIVYVCLLRRTGSLWAPITVHAVGNISIWYPLLGQYFVPRNPQSPGDLSTWAVQLACLAIVAVALPVYVWMARERRDAQDCFAPTVPHAAVSK